MDSRFFERKCFTTTSDCLLEFMQEQVDDSSLTFNMEKDTKEIFLYSPAYDVEYNENDIKDYVGRELNVEINNIFVDGNKYCAVIYFTQREAKELIKKDIKGTRRESLVSGNKKAVELKNKSAYPRLYNETVKHFKLPQELFAEALWLEWDTRYGVIHKEKLPDLLRRYNLKLKKEKTLDDIQLAFGRGLKDTFGNTAKQIEKIAEEIDKICIIANWGDAVENLIKR